MHNSTLYPASYFTDRVDPRRAEMYQQERARIQQRLGCDTGTVKDIGCAGGEFLGLFPGWIHYGRDPHHPPVPGIRYNSPAYKSLDLVVMRGVLQHLDDPFWTLKNMLGCLKPGGLLAILATPNTGSLTYRLWQTLPALDPPRNITLWSARILQQTLLNIGYQHIEVVYPYWGTPYAQPLRDLGRFLTGRPGAFPGNMMECYARAPK